MAYEWRRTFLILHGVENRRPAEHWQCWLAGELRSRGEQVFYPQLPDPDAPSLDAWLEVVEAELRLARGERVVVCHSLSSVLWMQRAARRPDAPPVDRLLLVCPPGPGVFGWQAVAGFDPSGLELGSLQLAASARLVCTDNDPYCPEPAAEVYARPLGCAVTVVPGGGHLSAAEGYGPWPAVLDWCLNGTVAEAW
ncbi:hypothetical protein GXW83_06695 [Streptacidiphilus sp. PB12-B1b]|uniref:RBBP9/YdeN family alpha/beta hydrolase n=1 Tax=Streptacidiphilus sp. PB12-B1b TaxID=2705012 RepID=UPI0015FA8F67|nr:alpha/beta hydrolase [Streptacidiphilus sp. PB12-B1b]QMU75477.1 hypothetical protein GXW83_06695 [Streptacidiphilus sp. PB12-B1b]